MTDFFSNQCYLKQNYRGSTVFVNKNIYLDKYGKIILPFFDINIKILKQINGQANFIFLKAYSGRKSRLKISKLDLQIKKYLITPNRNSKTTQVGYLNLARSTIFSPVQ